MWQRGQFGGGLEHAKQGAVQKQEGTDLPSITHQDPIPLSGCSLDIY